MFGIKVKSLFSGLKNLYGSVRQRECASEAIFKDLLLLGMETMLITSMFSGTGFESNVAFQSPPMITDF
jgi:hypothetical protein